MAEVKDALPSNADIAGGIDLIGTDDWVDMTAFFDSAIHGSPSTEAKMRAKLGMAPGDTFPPEFVETAKLYNTLEDLGHEFEDKVVAEVLACADDIVHYQTTADTVYSRLATLIDRYDNPDPTSPTNPTEEAQDKLDELVKLWKAGTVKGRSDQIKTRFSSALETLITEAKTRAKRAEDLQKSIRGPTGFKSRVEDCKVGFEDKATQFTTKFGKEGASVTKLKTDLASLQDELDQLRKKERDEVIVLGTSPVYLVVPFFGPFILAGVDIGVGVDLAHVRAAIDGKFTEAQQIQDQIALDQRFMAYYTTGKTMVADIANKIEGILPKLDQLGLGWRAVAADIGAIVSSLSDTGRDQLKSEDYFDFVSTLTDAQKSWKAVAVRADHFRSVARPVAAHDTADLLKKAA